MDGVAAGEVEDGALGDGECAARAGPPAGSQADRAGLDVDGGALLMKLTAMVEAPVATVFSRVPSLVRVPLA